MIVRGVIVAVIVLVVTVGCTGFGAEQSGERVAPVVQGEPNYFERTAASEQRLVDTVKEICAKAPAGTARQYTALLQQVEQTRKKILTWCEKDRDECGRRMAQLDWFTQMLDQDRAKVERCESALALAQQQLDRNGQMLQQMAPWVRQPLLITPPPNPPPRMPGQFPGYCLQTGNMVQCY